MKIREKWPRWFFATPHDKSTNITVQQDNARPHMLLDDPEILAAGSVAGWNICMAQQPANSPDLNVLDLGLFNAIDKLQHKHPRRNVQELVVAIKHAYENLPPYIITRAFVSLQGVMEQILLNDGDNNFALPHMGKAKMEKDLGGLPLQHQLSLKSKKSHPSLEAAVSLAAHRNVGGRRFRFG